MKRRAILTGGSAAVLVPALTSPVSAQASRTWVSGTGSDANPCTRTAPCQTFAGALSKTAARGEISALDPGGFGGVSITKAITIDGGGFVASSLVAGSNAITIAAEASDDVILRNIQINGLQANSLSGVRIISAKSVTLQNVEINRMTTGVEVTASSSAMRVVINNSRIHTNSGDGIRLRPPSSGADGAANRLTVSNSTITGNLGAGIRLGQTPDAFRALAVADGNVIANCGDGILSDGAQARIHISDNTISSNTTGLRAINSGKIVSFQNNRIATNLTDGVPTNTADEG